MAKIYKISAYLIDVNKSIEADGDLEMFLSGNGFYNLMRDLYGLHVRVEGAEFEWDDDLPINNRNCDLAELEKYFPETSTIDLASFRNLPMPGETWKHFKGKEVEIIGICRSSENPSAEYVCYNCSNIMYVRPVYMFMSEVDREKYPNVEQKYRFERVDG